MRAKSKQNGAINSGCVAS